MIDLPTIEADFKIRVPLANADVSKEDLRKIGEDFYKDGLRVALRTEQVYPISDSWAEIAIVGASFLAGAGASHYAGKPFDALDRFLRAGINRVNLGISHRKKIEYQDVLRNNRDEAITLIKQVLEKLEADERESTKTNPKVEDKKQ